MLKAVGLVSVFLIFLLFIFLSLNGVIQMLCVCRMLLDMWCKTSNEKMYTLRMHGVYLGQQNM